MGSRQDLQRHSVMRMIGEIKLLLNDEDCLYSPNCRERLSKKGVQRCRVTNRRQPAGQKQAISSHFACSRGTILVSIETLQTVSLRQSEKGAE